MNRTTIERFEVFMLLDDKHRDLLKRMMSVQGISGRTLARAAGYSSHSYMTRLLRGEARWVEAEAAVRIAAFLGVPVDLLFVAKTATVSVRAGHRKAS